MDRNSTARPLTLFKLITPARQMLPAHKPKLGLEVIRETLGHTWKEMALLLSREATVFDSPCSESHQSPFPLKERQLRDAARDRVGSFRALLNNTRSPQLVREFGISPESLGDRHGPTTLHQGFFSLIWFYAWRHAQQIATLPKDHLRKYVSGDIQSGDDAGLADTIVDRTILSPDPMRKLASIVTLASTLQYSFELKHVYTHEDSIPEAVLHNSRLKVTSTPEACRLLFPDVVSISMDDVDRQQRLVRIDAVSMENDTSRFHRQLRSRSTSV